MFSKAIFTRVVKSQDCVVKAKITLNSSSDNKLNTLQNNKNCDISKLKAFADAKLGSIMKFFLDRVKHIVVKGEDLATSISPLRTMYFKNSSSSGSLKLWTVG